MSRRRDEKCKAREEGREEGRKESECGVKENEDAGMRDADGKRERRKEGKREREARSVERPVAACERRIDKGIESSQRVCNWCDCPFLHCFFSHLLTLFFFFFTLPTARRRECAIRLCPCLGGSCSCPCSSLRSLPFFRTHLFLGPTPHSTLPARR